MTTTEHTTTDPRPHHRNALSWVSELVTRAGADRMGDPTPCDEFDVRALIAHLVSVERKLRATALGDDIWSVPHVTPGIDDAELPDTFRTHAAAMLDAWSDDRLLDTTVTVPWGDASGRVALQGYLNEILVHGWDLAVATGQDPEADPALVAHAEATIRRLLPAEGRAGSTFDPVVEPDADAGPTERLANWSGRVTAGWR